MTNKNYFFALALLILSLPIFAQEEEKKGQFSGNLQIDAQTYQDDTLTGAYQTPEKMGMNAYGNLRYSYGNLTAGIRFESYLNTMEGFDVKNDGTGIPYKFFTYKNEELEFTLGNFYEQFGSGMTLRAYEEKTLGIDNAFEGVLAKYNPYDGIYFKGLVGKQRNYWDLSAGIVRGLDGEVNINEALKLDSLETQIIWGGSFVSKYQADRSSALILPENVAMLATRLNLQWRTISWITEYGYKANDPSSDNNNNYQDGQALMTDISYTQGSFGMVAGAKWVNNMSFRSDRAAQQNDLLIGCLPAISKNHTYNFAAMYPYATQLNGEAGIKGEIFYRFKPKTTLGGQYGTTIAVNYSRVNSINKAMLDSVTIDSVKYAHWDQYSTTFLSVGNDRLYEDLSIEINKKFTKNLSSIFTAQYLAYNKQLIEGYGGTIEAFVLIADATYKLRPRHSLRVEAQWLTTKQDLGDWAGGTIEYTISPNWFVAVTDLYNYGNPETKKQLHYYLFNAGYTRGANRIAIGYGRQRQGVMCVGGVCRVVPASTGFSISITSTF